MSKVPDITKENLYILLANYTTNLAYISLYDAAVSMLKQNTAVYACYNSAFRTYIAKFKSDENSIDVVLGHLTKNFNRYFLKNYTTQEFVTLLHKTITGDASTDPSSRKKAVHAYLVEIMERAYEYIAQHIGEAIVLERTGDALPTKLDTEFKRIVNSVEHVLLTGDNPNKMNKAIDEVHVRYKRIITDVTTKYNNIVTEYKNIKQSYDNLVQLISAAGLTSKLLQDAASKQIVLVSAPLARPNVQPSPLHSPQSQQLQQHSQHSQHLQQQPEPPKIEEISFDDTPMSFVSDL